MLCVQVFATTWSLLPRPAEVLHSVKRESLSLFALTRVGHDIRMQDSCIQEQERTGWLGIIQLFAPGEAVEPPDLVAGAYFEDG